MTAPGSAPDVQPDMAPDLAARLTALIVEPGIIPCPLCDEQIPATGQMAMSVYDRFVGHVASHSVLEFVEALAVARAT